MKHIGFLFLFSLSTFLLKAQVDCASLSPADYNICDQFTAGSDLSDWSGNVDLFQINDSEQLQLNDSEAGEAMIVQPTGGDLNAEGDTEWRVYLQLDFSPSGSNNAQFWLAADQSDLSSANGYYLQLGEGGSDDAIRLFTEGGSNDSTPICSTEDGGISGGMDLYLRIIRSAAGEWDIYTAPTVDDAALTLVASGTNTDFSSASFMGLLCEYTSSNSDAFFMDEVFVNGMQADVTPPTLVATSVIDASTIQLTFDEPLDVATAENTSNYLFSFGIASAVVDADPAIVTVTTSSPMTTGEHNLNVSGVTDLAGNLFSETIPITYFEASTSDVVITELFPDPEPQVGLPVFEFVELYNRTDLSIDLSNWSLTDSYPEEGATIPPTTLAAGEYLIICPTGDAFDAWSALPDIQVVAVPSFPSLNNSGDEIALLNNAGNLVDVVAYSSDWYRDEDKDNGGWTLERINVDNLCDTPANWIASEDEDGGTPGAVNSVQGLYVDDLAPIVISASIDSPSSLELFFNETLDATTAANPANYSMSEGIGIATVIEDTESVVLMLDADLQAGILYTLTINGVEDCVDNATAGLTVSVALPGEPEPYDVLVNEVYVDLEPQVGFDLETLDLPEAEFIELYNRSDKTIALENWFLIDAKPDTAVLGNYLLLPNSYVILTDAEEAYQFTERGIPVLGVDNMVDLNTTSETLTLTDATDEVIDHMYYSTAYYKDEVKDGGGWTIERIDPQNPCGTYYNYTASVDPSGGTPGVINSVDADNSDESAPILLRAEMTNAITLRLYFNESIERAALLDPTNYTISGGIGQPVNVSMRGAGSSIVQLQLANSIDIAQVYTVTVSGLSDCVGNALNLENEVDFGFPTAAEPNDIVINEILFNPDTGGTDYVELYNRSNKTIDLSEWYTATKDVELSLAAPLEDFKIISLDRWTILPDSYIVLSELSTIYTGDAFTPDRLRNSVLNNYGGGCGPVPENVFISVDLPSLNDDLGAIAVSSFPADSLTLLTNVLDLVIYEDDYHNAQIDDDNGIALERVDYNEPSEDPNNWHSAAASACYGTPGYLNSQFYATAAPASSISLDPPAFSPDGDGDRDLLNILYTFDTPGYSMNLTIFDSRGREVKHLVRNEVLGSEGRYKWDGSNDAGDKVAAGIYIILAEVINDSGDVQRFKESCVVSAKF